jgi:hypothetical protein
MRVQVSDGSGYVSVQLCPPLGRKRIYVQYLHWCVVFCISSTVWDSGHHQQYPTKPQEWFPRPGANHASNAQYLHRLTSLPIPGIPDDLAISEVLQWCRAVLCLVGAREEQKLWRTVPTGT